MNNSEKFFIAVLCHGLGRVTGNFFDSEGIFDSGISDETKAEAKKLAEKHSLIGLYNEGLLKLGYNCSDKVELTLATAALVAKNADRFNAMKKVAEKIAAEGVNVVAMKGFSVREYYPLPEYRSFGDIDLLIKKSDEKKAIGVLKKLGFHQKNNEPHVVAMKRGEQYFELHTSLLGDDFFVPNGAEYLLRNPWNYTIDHDVNGIKLFSSEFHFMYLILHIAKHFYCMGAGVRMFLDIALMTEKEDIDWKLAGEYIKAADIAEFTKSVYAVCKIFFGTEMPEILKSELWENESFEPLDNNVCDMLIDYVLKGGIFGFDGPVYEVAKLRQTYLESGQGLSADEGKTLKKAKARAIIPDRSTMERRYAFCRNKPWLLPFAHIVRVVNVITNRKRAKSAALRMKRLCESDDFAKQQVEFYKNIGL